MNENYESKVCFETIKSTLDGMEWKYEVKEEFLIVTSAKGDNMAIPLFIGIDPEKPTIFIHSPMPFDLKENKLDLMARAVCEVNLQMLIGSFDLDSKNKRIVFKVTLPFPECLISEAAVKYIVLLACYMSDKYNSKLYDLNRGALDLESFLNSFDKA